MEQIEKISGLLQQETVQIPPAIYKALYMRVNIFIE